MSHSFAAALEARQLREVVNITEALPPQAVACVKEFPRIREPKTVSNLNSKLRSSPILGED
jgi:hypothetical protein